jgi:hypothetical protein
MNPHAVDFSEFSVIEGIEFVSEVVIAEVWNCITLFILACQIW